MAYFCSANICGPLCDEYMTNMMYLYFKIYLISDLSVPFPQFPYRFHELAALCEPTLPNLSTYFAPLSVDKKLLFL